MEPIVNKYQPNCLFYHNVNRADLRWGGSESGTVGYPCWSSFPYPYSHSNATDGVTDHNKLLAHGDPNGKSGTCHGRHTSARIQRTPRMVLGTG